MLVSLLAPHDLGAIVATANLANPETDLASLVSDPLASVGNLPGQTPDAIKALAQAIDAARGDDANFKAAKSKIPSWVPARFAGKRRVKAECLDRQIIGLDFDALEADTFENVVAAVKGLLPNCYLAIHTTATERNADGTWRVRVYVILDRQVTPAEWEARVKPFMKSLGETDQNAIDVSRLLYLPVPTEGYRCAVVSGPRTSVDSLPIAAVVSLPVPAPTMPQERVAASTPVEASDSMRKRHTAAAAVLGTAWPEKGRHGAQLALAGALKSSGLNEDDALEILCAVCAIAGDEDPGKREQTIAATWATEVTTGWTTLKGHVDPAVVESARRLLDARVDGTTWADILGRTEAPAAPTKTVTRLTASERSMRVGGDFGARYTTGIPTIDRVTRGGFMKAKFAVVGGAPGAGKTALAMALAHKWLVEGFFVGVLAADEDADALLIRLGQLCGIDRDALEKGDHEARSELAAWCSSVNLLLVDGDEGTDTVESLSEELRDAAKGHPSVLMVDSIQTARSRTSDEGNLDKRSKVGRVVAALKMAAKRDGHFVLATSELARGSYRSKKQAENSNLLSSFKEAGEIEYGVTFAMGLVSQSGSSGLVDAEIVKNRLGTKGELTLRLDQIGASVTEVAEASPEPEPGHAADPTPDLRSRILLALETGDYSSGDKVASTLGVRAGPVRAELKDLVAKGIVTEVKDGRGKVYVVDCDAKRLARVLASVPVHPWSTAGKLAAHASVPVTYVEELVRRGVIRPRLAGPDIDGFMVGDVAA